jgi:hypothetical protein
LRQGLSGFERTEADIPLKGKAQGFFDARRLALKLLGIGRPEQVDAYAGEEPSACGFAEDAAQFAAVPGEEVVRPLEPDVQ